MSQSGEHLQITVGQQSNPLARFPELSAQIEQLSKGGIILGALSSPERGMDGFVQSHLGNVAMLNARGDTTPERPTYVFNPDSGLLINYAYRRSPNPDREGFFADVVELDQNGKPRQGVSVVNPFDTSTGFVHVAVGENNNGFAPSSVGFRLDSDNLDDPTSIVPPSIETADLLSMLAAEPIPEDMNLEEFQATRKAAQEEMRGRVQARHYKNYPGTEQAMTPRTDAQYHLIITDRDDTSAFETASREVGVYPLILPATDVVSAALEYKRMDAPINIFERLATYVPIGPKFESIRDLLHSTVPAFLTYDFEQFKRNPEGGHNIKEVPFPDADSRLQDVHFAVSQLINTTRYGELESVLARNPFFSKLFNTRIFVELDDLDPVKKREHGVYEFAIDSSDADCMKIYTDWLRKARLDFALTLYLRGLSKL